MNKQSDVSSPLRIQEMLEFFGSDAIHPLTESDRMSSVNEALARLKSNQARYRIVLPN